MGYTSTIIWTVFLSTSKSLKPALLQYAADYVLLSHSPEGLQEAISKLPALYTRFGLEINVRKTEVLS